MPQLKKRLIIAAALAGLAGLGGTAAVFYAHAGGTPAMAAPAAASVEVAEVASRPVTDLQAHIPRMEGFHRRYMVSNKILRLWVNMARQLDIAMIVPQHGAPSWASQLSRISLRGSKTSNAASTCLMTAPTRCPQRTSTP